MHERTHASFFSGVGGLDLGLERAGWRTVSLSEIDAYASAVLAQRYPGVPNLGDIVQLANDVGATERMERDAGRGWQSAALWSGGFPCQDLSVAGKRRGLAGERSGLAFAFLDLVARHRPPWVLLENVPGLLSSNRGRDLSSLLGRLSELGYGVAGRVLDARYFGVAQRRRRVFLLATSDPGGRAGALRAAEVLSIAAGGGGHPAEGGEAGPGVAGGADGSPHTPRLYNALAAFGGWAEGAEAKPVSQRDYKSSNHLLVRPSPDAGRDGAADGVAGRLDDRDELAHTLTAPDTRHRTVNGRRQDGSRLDRIPQVVVNALDQRRGGADDNEAQAGHLVPTLRVGGRADGAGSSYDNTPWALASSDRADSDLLPLGLDSHRYRCCGNGVVSNVAEAIGWALRAVIERDDEEPCDCWRHTA